jgi:CDGSH-type Zn-finger protein
VSGGVRVVAADGTVLYEGERAALCRCGGSANKPFCDGTHKTIDFEG